MSFRTEFARRLQPTEQTLTDWLTASPEDMRKAIRPLYSINRRARLPRFDPATRRRVRSLTPEERELCHQYATLLLEHPELCEDTGLSPQTFLDLLELDAELGRLIQAAGTVAQAAEDGMLLIDSTLSALNARVLLRVEETLGDPKAPRALRDRLMAIWGEWYRSEADAEYRQMSAERRRDRRLAALRKALSEASESAQVLRALEALRAPRDLP